MPVFKPGDRVSARRDIVRREGPYARGGDEGVVIETFKVKQSPNQKPVWYAKVLMDTCVKTFKTTSLELF